MRGSPGANYRQVAGLQRGLQVLLALTRLPNGIGSAASVAAVTGLHRTTCKRLLETLLAEGFVRRSQSDESYRLQMQVRQLSEGFTDDEWVSAVAMPELAELMSRVVWPSDLCTLDGDAMVVRETTHRFSPLSFHRNMVGRRMPVLCTASGRAYFAFCPDTEMEQLLRVLSASADAEQVRLARDDRLVQRMVARTRKDGYAVNDGDWKQEPHVGAIAVPLRAPDKVLGCINVVYLRRAIPAQEAVAKFLPALRQAATVIERGVSNPL